MHSDLYAALVAAGLEPTKPLKLPEGRIERFRPQGDKAGTLNAWIVWHSTPVESAVFGSWKDGIQRIWRASTNERLTAAERAEQQRKYRAAQQARIEEEARVRAEAAARAEKLWNSARPANNDHPYLQRKKVPAYGLRQLREQLVIPLRDATGRLWSLQFIDADGRKKFLTGGRIQGCYLAIGRPRDVLLLCEGYATAATLFQATGHATAACFNCGNLAHVARALRAKFPRLRFVIAADNDTGTAGNPGLTAAQQAARLVGALVAYPQFEEARHV